MKEYNLLQAMDSAATGRLLEMPSLYVIHGF